MNMMGATLESRLDIKGGAFLEVSRPMITHSPKTVQLFYIARSVYRCYISLSCLKALQVVQGDLPTPGSSSPQARALGNGAIGGQHLDPAAKTAACHTPTSALHH